tara:strand:+ start:794 stop:1021 length:228 start_codon:yes stop_codon:yes gene_type:complete
MKTSTHKKGDLVFLPSSVRLIQFREQVGLPLFVSKHVVTNKPSRVLLVEPSESYCKVLYNGEYWFAEEKDIYGDL